jgi:hypothetical protein
MAKENDLDVVLNHLDGMYFQSTGNRRSDLAAINTLAHSHELHDQSPNAAVAPNTPLQPMQPIVIVATDRSSFSLASVPADSERKTNRTRGTSPPIFLEHSHVSAITIELDSSLRMPVKQRSPKIALNQKKKSGLSDTYGQSNRPKVDLTVGSISAAALNWSSSPWTIQSRARKELPIDLVCDNAHVDSKSFRHVSPTARSHRTEKKEDNSSPRLRVQKPDFVSAMVMVQAMLAQQHGLNDAKALAARSVYSLAVLLRHSTSTLGGSLCATLFQGIFRSTYHADDQCCSIMLEFSNWIQNSSSENDSILPSIESLHNLCSCSEKLEIIADNVHDQNKKISEMHKVCDEQEQQIRKLSLDLATSDQRRADVELSLLAAISKSNSSMVGGDMSQGFVSNVIYQDALKNSEQLRDDLKDIKSQLILQQALVMEKELTTESFVKTIQEHEQDLQAMNQSLNDSQMVITSKDLQIEKLRQQCIDEYSRNPIHPCSDVDLIMNSSTWVSKLVRSEDAFDFKHRLTDTKTQNSFSQRDQCLGLLISWINKHLESAKVDIHVSNFGRDLSSGVVFVELFRRCMGNNPYYQQKCDAASVEIDTDSRLKHVAEMASTLLNCPIAVSNIVCAEPKTIWIIISELFNTNPTLDPCSIANLKVLSSDAIHVIRRQSLGIILSDLFESTSNSSMFSSIKESIRDTSKVKRTLSDLPHDVLYAHMNPNVVISMLNGLSPRWALHKLPVKSVLESLMKLGGNGCLALCVSILHRHRSQLSDVFRYYSLLGRESATSLPSLDMGEMEIFIADAQIDLSYEVAEKLLQTACRECSSDDFVDDCTLDLTSFLVFLIRVAIEPGSKLSSKDSDTEYMVATNLTRIVQNHVCSNAIRLVIDFQNTPFVC